MITVEFTRLRLITFFAESYIDEQLNSTYVLRDLAASGKIAGSIRAEVGARFCPLDPGLVGDDDIVYLGPFAVAPDFQVGNAQSVVPYRVL